MAEKIGSMVISSSGAIVSNEGDWDKELDQVKDVVLASMQDAKHAIHALSTPGEALRRMTISYTDYDYVITGKDAEYHVFRWRRGSK